MFTEIYAEFNGKEPRRLKSCSGRLRTSGVYDVFMGLGIFGIGRKYTPVP